MNNSTIPDPAIYNKLVIHLPHNRTAYLFYPKDATKEDIELINEFLEKLKLSSNEK